MTPLLQGLVAKVAVDPVPQLRRKVVEVLLVDGTLTATEITRAVRSGSDHAGIALSQARRPR